MEADVTMSGVNSFIGFVLNLSIIIKNEEFLFSYQLLWVTLSKNVDFNHDKNFPLNQVAAISFKF